MRGLHRPDVPDVVGVDVATFQVFGDAPLPRIVMMTVRSGGGTVVHVTPESGHVQCRAGRRARACPGCAATFLGLDPMPVLTALDKNLRSLWHSVAPDSDGRRPLGPFVEWAGQLGLRLSFDGRPADGLPRQRVRPRPVG